MTAFLILALPAALCSAGPVPAAVLNPDSLAAVYHSGKTWDAFYEGVDARRALWDRTWAGATVAGDLAARAAGAWRLLVITEPGCSDSANSLPYVAKLVEEVELLELRIVNSTVGRPWMEAHRSPDGRAATPTILVLDASYRLRGCWVEQPAGLQAIWLDVVARDAAAREIDRKMAWYEADAGRETLRELIEVLEAAQRGEPICPGA
jgi:hypothetical protein